MTTADDVSRIIMLLKGVMDHGGPFWCYVALKPSQFSAFKAAQPAGEIDLYAFDDYGEVVVSGEGETPPYTVTEEVARMYGADPRTFFRDIDPLAEIAEKMRLLGYSQQPDPVPSPPSGGSRWADRFGRRT
ncbi:MAG: hypothetical protein ACK530_03345 [Alphaproteobacteria bacterium]|jgi:hypothetical protein